MPLSAGLPILQQSIVAAMKASAAAPNTEAAQQLFATQLAAAINTFILSANPIPVVTVTPAGPGAGTATIS